jgi:hypothetical protein
VASKSIGGANKEVTMTQLHPSTKVLAMLCAATAGVPALAQSLPPKLKLALSTELRFQPGDISHLEAGQAVARVIETGDPEDVMIVGAIRIGVSPSQFVARYRNVTEFESGPGVPAAGKFATPPQIKDLANLSLTKSEWDDIRDCKPGECSFKVSDDGLEKLRSGVNWKSSTSVSEANRFLRQMWLEYLLSYQAKGNAVLAAYHDTDRIFHVQDGLTNLINKLPVLQQYVPEIASYLLEYPKGKPAGAEEFFYWQKAEFGLKPVHRITHVVIQKKPTEHGDGYLTASKMLYASHYFRSALELRFLVPVQGPDGKPATYLIAIQRSYVDGLGGIKGKLLRGPILSKSREALEQFLVNGKGKLEGQS